MQVFTQLITFTTAPVAFAVTDANGNVITNCSQIYAEPASGSHAMFVEAAGLATGATAATKGVIKSLAAYNATASAIQDFWRVVDHKGGNLLQIANYQADGTSTEKMRVTFFVE